MDLCAETGLLYKLGNWSDGGCFSNRLVPSEARLHEMINKKLKNTVARQERPSRGKFADLQSKIRKDTEKKTRRLEARFTQQKAEIKELVKAALKENEETTRLKVPGIW